MPDMLIQSYRATLKSSGNMLLRLLAFWSSSNGRKYKERGVSVDMNDTGNELISATLSILPTMLELLSMSKEMDDVIRPSSLNSALDNSH